ncbi:homoserine kinase [Arcanobacterium hippocoleae]|uniref:homoserine kinase n=1 Tax=Arcanobacterium hippocoleae TaxID=149017 RepID=UPI00333F4B5D
MSVMQVRVPATTANLGPGFDSFGCALSLANTVTFEPSEKQLEWVGYKPEYATEDNLIYQAFRATFAYLGEPVAGVRISAREEIPFSRGLGSSAAMLVAGALGANAMSGNQLSLCQLLEITNRIEGHPDNLAPAFYGGLTASLVDDSGMPITRNYQLHESWEFLVLSLIFRLQPRKLVPCCPGKWSLLMLFIMCHMRRCFCVLWLMVTLIYCVWHLLIGCISHIGKR